MAYLDPKTLTCPKCDFSDEIRIVVGVGPSSEPGDTPYRRFQNSGGFIKGTKEDGTRDGTLLCPNDGTIVWTNKAGKKANP
ncbi:hypothetical protein [Litoreibacter janthinus]|uniref:Uncharacterized protein n=1 Tax=Litoreibacter janthinus TaxID=670154 RepID=A0A1I6GEW2_9RHOB|nr:hypothetical protein [Litoreibacter janthinus]SFR40651.1 hypothetical protein SAMN04488002_1352 [Litoreibacter janthinus]